MLYIEYIFYIKITLQFFSPIRGALIKKAVVLLITVGFVTIISALILYSFTLTGKEFERIKWIDDTNQFSVIFKDFVETLNEFGKDVNDSETLDQFLANSNIPLLADEKASISFSTFVETKMDKININALLYQYVINERDTQKEAYNTYIDSFFENFCQEYEIGDNLLFVSLLLDTVDRDEIERGSFSEIVVEDYDFTQGIIVNYAHLRKIIDHYYKISNDANIYKITKEVWSNYFYFGDKNDKSILDCERVEGDLVKFIIGQELDEEVDYCEMFKSAQDLDPLAIIKSMFHIENFSKNKKYLVQCEFSFNISDNKQKILFDYDIKSKRITNIEKYFEKTE